jgi:hypothetical protein
MSASNFAPNAVIIATILPVCVAAQPEQAISKMAVLCWLIMINALAAEPAFSHVHTTRAIRIPTDMLINVPSAFTAFAKVKTQPA